MVETTDSNKAEIFVFSGFDLFELRQHYDESKIRFIFFSQVK